jgi:hypothetical protein
MTYTTTIRIKANKRGKLVAHYWGRARRWLPLSVGEALGGLAVTNDAEAA